MLSKWKKQSVKNFLKTSPIFEAIDKAVSNASPLEFVKAGPTAPMVAHIGGPPNSGTGTSTFNQGTIVGGTISNLSSIQAQPSSTSQLPPKEALPHSSTLSRKEEQREKELQRLLKSENSEELLTLHLNQNKPGEDFKKTFKSSIEQNPSFPKTYEEISVVKIPLLAPEQPYENRTFFGDYHSSQTIENGLTNFVEEVVAAVKE